MEGLHYVVSTYTHTIWQHLLVFFLYSTAWRKTTKNALTFDLLHGRIWNINWVCVLIFLSLSCNLVLWYELNKKLRNILLCFPIPSRAKKKPMWRSRVMMSCKICLIWSHIKTLYCAILLRGVTPQENDAIAVTESLYFNPSSPKGVATTPQWFSPWCSKSHSQGVKLLRVPSSSSFPFILAKKIPNLSPTPGVG